MAGNIIWSQEIHLAAGIAVEQASYDLKRYIFGVISTVFVKFVEGRDIPGIDEHKKDRSDFTRIGCSYPYHNWIG